MKAKKLLSILLVLALLCTLFVPCVSADETSREIPFAIYKECRVQGFVGRDVTEEYYIIKSQSQLEEVLAFIEGNENSTAFPKPERDAKYTDAFFEEKAVIIGFYTFPSGSIRHRIESLYVSGDTLRVSRSVFSPSAGTCDMQYRFALMEVALSDIEGVTRVVDFFPGDIIEADIVSVYGLRGDTDYDEKINVKDATIVQKCVASLYTFAPATELMADANADGEVNIKDATEIQKYSAGFELNSGIGYLVAIYEEYLPVPGVPDLQQTLAELEEMIDYAKWAVEPGSNYIAATVNRLFDEIDKAKALYESENPAYEDVVAQTEALRAAVDGLEYVNLDVSELAALMNEAQQIIDAGGYTEKSTDVLIDAMFKGQMACLYGQSQNEVTEAINAIEEAMAKLVPLYGDSERYIEFIIAEECRVWDSYSYETELYLVKSPSQMDEILDAIGGYEKLVRDEKYDEAFFEENSLVISLNIVGGGNCFQRINNLVVKGDTLTVSRTVYQPELPTPDMNYQYVLMEVKNSDVKGVTVLKDNTSYYVDDDEPVPNPATTITVYFENTQEWTEVKAYYWGETAGKDWPGEPMNILCQGLNGYDLYSLEIPADAEGIVFNSPSYSVQTEDVTTLFDEMLCSPSTMSSPDRWNVRVVDINEADIFPEPPADDEPAVPPAPTSPAEDGIEFTVLQESRVQGWGELYEEEELEIYLVESVDEMDRVLSRIRGEATDQWEPKPVRDEKLNDEYFAENTLIVALVPLGSGSYTQEVQKLTIEGNMLTIYTKILTPSVSTCDMNYRYLLIEVKPDEVEAVEEFDYASEYEWIDVEEMY